MPSNILLPKLTPYTDKITDDYSCAVWHNQWTAGKLLCINQILEKKCDYNADCT